MEVRAVSKMARQERRLPLQSSIIILILIILCTSRSEAWLAQRLSTASLSPTATIPRNTLVRFASPSPSNNYSALLDVAAGITQDSCRLLGSKSLGVDYGLVRTGLAVTVGYEPEPLPTLVDLNTTQACLRIASIASTLAVDRIVVGLPLHKNGSEAEQTHLTLHFATQLLSTVVSHVGPHVPLQLLDERYTSKEAKARAHAIDPSLATYGTLDAASACIILENFYDTNGEGSKTLELPQAEMEDCIQQYETRKQEQELQRQEILAEREAKMLRRKKAIEQGRLEAASAANDGAMSSKKRKKKKKR